MNKYSLIIGFDNPEYVEPAFNVVKDYMSKVDEYSHFYENLKVEKNFIISQGEDITPDFDEAFFILLSSLMSAVVRDNDIYVAKYSYDIDDNRGRRKLNVVGKYDRFACISIDETSSGENLYYTYDYNDIGQLVDFYSDEVDEDGITFYADVNEFKADYNDIFSGVSKDIFNMDRFFPENISAEQDWKSYNLAAVAACAKQNIAGKN